MPPPAVTLDTVGSVMPAAVAVGTAHSPPGTKTAATHGWPRCVNSAEGFSIKYPPTWYTTQIRPEEVCVQFHPSRFFIPLQSEYVTEALRDTAADLTAEVRRTLRAG